MSKEKESNNDKKDKINKFELSRLLSSRALELASGAKPKVKVEKKEALLSKDYVEIAIQEYKEDLLDLEIYKE